jgi:hypothetical protein
MNLRGFVGAPDGRFLINRLTSPAEFGQANTVRPLPPPDHPVRARLAFPFEMHDHLRVGRSTELSALFVEPEISGGGRPAWACRDSYDS